ncbi:sh3 domain-containing protein [Quercus suber]|uniref:Sh3 domain-containing protein n=1 Tax=Quercus suber TaxID=58331 RepID=A0AAW0JYJ4_QUESU
MFRGRDPQRVCDAYYDRLDPLQGVLINTISNAVQVAKHDVIDWTCTRGWLNLPLGLSLKHEIYKASNTLRSCCQSFVKRFSLFFFFPDVIVVAGIDKLNPDKSIPLAIWKGARGLAILTIAKIGTGLVISQRSDGSWSTSSAVFFVGLEWGAQIGGELMDLIVLHDSKVVKKFCSHMHFSLGVDYSAAEGLGGRVLEADLHAGDRGSGMCYTYSCSKGIMS